MAQVMTESQVPTDALASLRHLYSNLVNGGVRDTASAKRIAEGLLAPVIEDLERRTSAPVGVGEVAERYRNAIASACEGWTMPDGLRKHLETALWSPPTPQPTQAQAGAVPLPKFLELKFHARRDKKATVTLLFPGHEAADAWVRGIKGGQHGADT